MEYQQTASAWDPCATLSTSLTLAELSKASSSFSSAYSSESATPVLKLIAIAKDKGYKRVCLPLTTKKWEERWSRMCLLPVGGSEKDKEDVAKEAEQWRLSPGFHLDETTITRLGASQIFSHWCCANDALNR